MRTSAALLAMILFAVPAPVSALTIDGSLGGDQPLVWMKDNRIEVGAKVYFQPKSDLVMHRSLPLLKELAGFLNAHPEIELVSVQGHSDSRGSAVANLHLTRERAKALVDILVHYGVDPIRLDARGYGELFPVDSRQNEEGWARNRRVEFFIIRKRK